MSLTETPSPPLRRPPRDMIQRKPRAPQVRGKLVLALRAIVWDGEELDGAAMRAGLTTQAVRQALAKPHVLQWVKKERDVFTAHARAQNVHHAVKIRSSDNAAAAMRAVDFIERIGDEARNTGGAAALPGLTIVLVNNDKSLNSQANTLDLQANVQLGTPFTREIEAPVISDD